MIRILLAALGLAACLAAMPAAAETLPDPQGLQARMGTPPLTVTVYEPHLTTGDTYVARDYLGYPAEAVIGEILGPDWRETAKEIEFRALDGYVSRIPVARFRPGKAFLVFGLADGSEFTVDNLAQNQKSVPPVSRKSMGIR